MLLLAGKKSTIRYFNDSFRWKRYSISFSNIPNNISAARKIERLCRDSMIDWSNITHEYE